MRKIPVEELEEGMVFDQTVFIDEGTIFVPPNIEVRAVDIERLKKWDIEFVETDGRPKKRSDKLVKPSEMWGILVDQELVDLYKDSIDYFDTFVQAYRDSNEIDSQALETFVNQFILDIKDNSIELIRLILSGNGKEKSFAKSAIDCCLFAIAIAKSLNHPENGYQKIVLASLLHDLGMLEISRDIIDKVGKLTEGELSKIKSHPVYSYQNIKKYFPEDIAQVAFQHHERWDGEGYPQGLKGEEILLEARIVSVADAFEAMTNKRSYRDSMIGYDAIKSILSDNSRRFDPYILKAFIRNVGIYPLGSIVLLNDSSICRVIDINKNAPLRPKVKVLIDIDGHDYIDDSGQLIDLFTKKGLFITRAINIDELLKEKNAG